MSPGFSSRILTGLLFGFASFFLGGGELFGAFQGNSRFSVLRNPGDPGERKLKISKFSLVLHGRGRGYNFQLSLLEGLGFRVCESDFKGLGFRTWGFVGTTLRPKFIRLIIWVHGPVGP